jgi:hypothetical protein
MKKPTIRNWIKYCAGTLAVSGMLVTTSCGSDNNQTADYENEVEAVENEPTTLERENVNDEIAAVEEVETDADDRQTVGGTNDVDYTSNEGQNQQLSNRSSDRSANSMPDMDTHLEEYKEPNQAIREELTDNNDMVGEQTMDRQNVSNTQTSDMNQESATDMNRQNTADMNQDASTEMDRENVTNTESQETSQYSTEQQNATQQTNTLDNQQKATNDAQQTEEMNQNTANQEDLNSYQYTNTTGTDQQGRENVANTDADRMEQEAAIISLYEIDMERLADEDRQRVTELMNEYKERRDRERGQMNPETGAYISPEVDARPTEGYEELMKTITDKIEYPHNALAAEMEGTVIVNFVVDENGEVLGGQAIEYVIVPTEEMQYTQPLNPTKFSEQEVEETKKEMMKEAVKAVTATSGQWEAAMQNGESVPAEIQLPIRFRMPDSDTIGSGEY